MILNLTAKAQENQQTIKFDTIYLKRGNTIQVNNRTYISRKDTILFIPGNIPYKINHGNKSDLYERLDSSAQYNQLARQLRNMLFVNQHKTIKRETGSTSRSEDSFLDYKNKIIRKIEFRQLDVFGPTLEDTSLTADSWLERTGNKLHFNTRLLLLRNNMIVHEGDALDPLKIADNERLLREASYIQDARIFLKPVLNAPDSVDLYVVVKDLWPKAFDLQIGDVNSGNFTIWDKNILGTGHELAATMYWNGRKSKTPGYEGNYTIPNMWGTFIRGKGTYLNSFGNETYGIQLERNFYTPNVKYAGGLSFIGTNKPDHFEYTDTALIAKVSYFKSDFWLGRSFIINPNPSFGHSRKNLTVAFRVNNTSVIKRPKLSDNLFYNYQDRTLYLSSLTYSSQSFYKSNLIYNYGRTEDIPLGFSIQMISGYEMREFENRYFWGGNAAYANYYQKLGYFYFYLGYDGFEGKHGIEQGLISAKVNHFSALYKISRFRFRHFIDLDYTRGINRFKDEFLTINDDYGLTGFLNDSIRGYERLNLHLESVMFSPWYFYEFRFVFFTSAEFSMFGNKKDFWTNPVYSTFGFGIRIRNERLVFNTLEFRFNFYPNMPPFSRTENVSVSGEQLLSPSNFSSKPPSISTYR